LFKRTFFILCFRISRLRSASPVEWGLIVLVLFLPPTLYLYLYLMPNLPFWPKPRNIKFSNGQKVGMKHHGMPPSFGASCLTLINFVNIFKSYLLSNISWAIRIRTGNLLYFSFFTRTSSFSVFIRHFNISYDHHANQPYQ
jgi:hypothetical protein